MDQFLKSPNIYNILSLEPYKGKNSDLPEDARAFPHRNVYFDIFVDSFYTDKTDEHRAKEWLKDMYESKELRPFWAHPNGKLEYYQNYPNGDYTDYEWGYFKENYPKLQKVKHQWDPSNVFGQFPQAITQPAKKHEKKKKAKSPSSKKPN